jgi:hypothetical protein
VWAMKRGLIAVSVVVAIDVAFYLMVYALIVTIYN